MYLNGVGERKERKGREGDGTQSLELRMRSKKDSRLRLGWLAGGLWGGLYSIDERDERDESEVATCDFKGGPRKRIGNS